MPPCLTLSIIRYGSRVSEAIRWKTLHPFQHLGVVAIEMWAFRSSSTAIGPYIFFTVFRQHQVHLCHLFSTHTNTLMHWFLFHCQLPFNYNNIIHISVGFCDHLLYWIFFGRKGDLAIVWRTLKAWNFLLIRVFFYLQGLLLAVRSPSY